VNRETVENNIKAGLELFREYKEDLICLYSEAFYQHDHSEKLKNKIGEYFEHIFDGGFGIFTINDHKLIAAMLITPPKFDKMMPSEITNKINPEKSLYIAELFVDKNMRGKGYGKQLMDYFFNTTDKSYTTFIIRVLTNNTQAINLYKKYLFEPTITVLQKKIDLKENVINLEKTYLIRHLTHTK
jgi:ribosomal protein S18 acetylase RimI-like enzyme